MALPCPYRFFVGQALLLSPVPSLLRNGQTGCLSYLNRLSLTAVQIDQRALQQARLRRQYECGKICNILRFTQPYDIGFADMLFDGSINITAVLRRLGFQQSSQALGAHRSRICRFYLAAVAKAYIREPLCKRHACAVDGTSDCKFRTRGAPANADNVQDRAVALFEVRPCRASQSDSAEEFQRKAVHPV